MPVSVFVKFHYDRHFGHVFVAIINRTKFLYPFSNKKKYYAEEVMMVITDDKGVVCDISRSVTDFIGLPV